MLKCNLTIILFLLFPFIASAQVSSAETTNESHAINNIEIRFGLLSKFSSTNNFTVSGISTKNNTNGFLGAVSYTRWLKYNLALTVYGGVLNADAKVTINSGSVSTESATVIPFLIGIKYEPIEINSSEKIRTYITVLAGPFFGYSSNVSVDNSTVNTGSVSETSFGSFAGAGIDFALSKLFMMGIRGGYYLVSDFKSRVGFEKNYSSPEFSVSIGIIF